MSKQARPKQTAWTPFVAAQTVKIGNGEVGQMWHNSLYTVLLSPVPANDPTAPKLVHLSIRRNDREPVRDWRHLQRIKNELVGAECEGFEIFPANRHLVDTANQYHMWVFTDPNSTLGVGWRERLVADANETTHASGSKARQRPFAPDERPADAVSAAELERRQRAAGIIS